MLTRRDRRAIDRAVREAERETGLQVCVYFGPGTEDARAHAEELFVNAGLHELPAVLILVAPDRKKVELVTAADVRERLPDEACERVVVDMMEHFARDGYIEGLVLGIGEIAEIAGPGTAAGTTDLPNVLD